MLSCRTIFDRLEDYKVQYGVSAGARIGVLPDSTPSLGGEESVSYSDAHAVTKPNDLDLFLRILPGKERRRLTKKGSSIDSFPGHDESLGSLRDHLLPAPAQDVLTNLGFSGSGSFIPERFARDWYEKATQARVDRLRAVEEEMRQRATAAMLRASQEGEGGSSLNWKDDGIERSLHGVEAKIKPRSLMTGRKWLRRALSGVIRTQHVKGRLDRMGSSETLSSTDNFSRFIDSNLQSHSSLVDTGSKTHAITDDVNHPEHRETTEVNTSGTKADMKTKSEITTCSRVAISENCKWLTDMRTSETNSPISADSVFSLTKHKNILPPSNSERPPVETVPSSQRFTLEGPSEVSMPQKIEESAQFLKLLSLNNNVPLDSSKIPESLGQSLLADIVHNGLRPNIDSTVGVDIPVSSRAEQLLSDSQIRMDRDSSKTFVAYSLSERSKEVQTDDRTLSPIIFQKFETNCYECSEDDDDDSFVSDSPFQSDAGEKAIEEINQTLQAKDQDSEAGECLTNDAFTEMEHADRLLLNLTLDSEVDECLTDDTPVSRKRKIKPVYVTNDETDTVDVSTLLCTTCLSTIRSMIRQKVDRETLCVGYLGKRTNRNLKTSRQTDKKSKTKPTTLDATKGTQAKRIKRNRRLVKRYIISQKKSHTVAGAFVSKTVKTRRPRRLVAGRLVGLKRMKQTFRLELGKIANATKYNPTLARELQQNDVEEEEVASMDPGWSESAELQPRMFEDFVEPLHDRKTASSNTFLDSRKTRRTRLLFASRKSTSLDAEEPRALSFWDDDESTGEPPSRAVVNYYSLREWSCISDVMNSLRSSSTTGSVAAEPHLSKDASPDLSRIFSGAGGYSRMQLKSGLDAADLLESSRKDADDDTDSAVDCSEHRKSCYRNWFQIQKSVKELIQAEEDSDVDIPFVAERWWAEKDSEDSEMLLAEEEGAPLKPLILEERGSFDALSVDEDDESGRNATLPENPVRDSVMRNGLESASVKPLQDVLYYGSVESTQISSNEVFESDGFKILPLQVGLLNERESEVKATDTYDDLSAELSDECDDFRQLRLLASLDVRVTNQAGDSCSALVSEWLVNSKDSDHSNMSDMVNKSTSSFAIMKLNEASVALNPGTLPVSLVVPFEVESPNLTNHSFLQRNEVDVTLVDVSGSSPLTFPVDSLVCSSGNNGSTSCSNCYSCSTASLDEKENRVSHDSFVSKSISNGAQEAQDPERSKGFYEEATISPVDAASRAGPVPTIGCYGHNTVVSTNTSNGSEDGRDPERRNGFFEESTRLPVNEASRAGPAATNEGYEKNKRSTSLPNCNKGDSNVDKTKFDQIDRLQGNVLRKIRHFENKCNTVKDNSRGKISSRCRPEVAGQTEAMKSLRMLKERTHLQEKKDDHQLQDKLYRTTSDDLRGTVLELSESPTRNATDTCLVNMVDRQAQDQYNPKSVSSSSNKTVMEMCRRFERGNSQLVTASGSNNRTLSVPRNGLLLSQVHSTSHSRDMDSSTILLSSSVAKDILENLKRNLEQRVLETSDVWNGRKMERPASAQFTGNDLEELIQIAADETRNKFLSPEHHALPPPPST